MLETVGCTPLYFPKGAANDLLYIRQLIPLPSAWRLRAGSDMSEAWRWRTGSDMSELLNPIHESLGDYDIINISGVEDEDIISTN